MAMGPKVDRSKEKGVVEISKEKKKKNHTRISTKFLIRTQRFPEDT